MKRMVSLSESLINSINEAKNTIDIDNNVGIGKTAMRVPNKVNITPWAGSDKLDIVSIDVKSTPDVIELFKELNSGDDSVSHATFNVGKSTITMFVDIRNNKVWFTKDVF